MYTLPSLSNNTHFLNSNSFHKLDFTINLSALFISSILTNLLVSDLCKEKLISLDDCSSESKII